MVSQSHLAHRTCRTIPYTPSGISRFGDMLLSTFGFRRWVSRCPGGFLLSTSSLFERNFSCTDTAHGSFPLMIPFLIWFKSISALGTRSNRGRLTSAKIEGGKRSFLKKDLLPSQHKAVYAESGMSIYSASL